MASKGKRLTLLVAAASVALGVIMAGVYRDDIAAWYRFTRDFESLGRNAQGFREYRHLHSGIVFVRLDAATVDIGTSDDELHRIMREYQGELVADFSEREGDVPMTAGYAKDLLLGNVSIEQPRHRVHLSPFLIAKYEVDQGTWMSVIGNNPSEFKSTRFPVHNVSWLDCVSFCEKTGLALPSEAQWEYGCKGGSAEDERLGEGGWYFRNSGGVVHPVGQKKPNRIGLHDLQGNVSEWCLDVCCFYTETAVGEKERIFIPSITRVHRGGNWRESAVWCRCSARGDAVPEHHDNDLGFRPVFNLR